MGVSTDEEKEEPGGSSSDVAEREGSVLLDGPLGLLRFFVFERFWPRELDETPEVAAPFGPAGCSSPADGVPRVHWL